MQIRDLASASGVTAQTIRFYERRGLIAPAARDRNGYRRYDEAAVARLAFIRSAQTAALTLAEIGTIIAIRQSGTAPCDHVSSLLANKLEDVQCKQQELRLLESELQHLIAESRHRDPANCEVGKVCHLLA